MTNKIVLIMTDRENFTLRKYNQKSSGYSIGYRYDLFNTAGEYIAIATPRLRKSVVYGAILENSGLHHNTVDRIFTARVSLPSNMNYKSFGDIYSTIKKKRVW